MYELLRPVNKTLCLIAAFVGGMVCAVQAKLQGITMLFFSLNGLALQIDLVFFGLWCAITGWLIFKSGFLPRILGALLFLDGLAYMMFLYPPFAEILFIPFMAIASAIGEIPLELWLMIKGVNAQRWKEKALLLAP